MTRDQAKALCEVFPRSAYTRETGMGRTEDSGWIVGRLKAIFPEFNWRVVLDRSGERTKWTLTVEDNDPREHFFDRLGGHCVHCGKTARELAIPEDRQNVDDDERDIE